MTRDQTSVEDTMISKSESGADEEPLLQGSQNLQSEMKKMNIQPSISHLQHKQSQISVEQIYQVGDSKGPA